MSLTHAQSEDVAQEVMVKVLRSLASFVGDQGFRVWSYTILLNTIRTEFRKNQRLQPSDGMDVQALASKRSQPELQTILQESQRALQIALSKLTEAQRTALVLMHIDGLSAVEIAHLQECSVDAVYQRIAEAKRKLRNDRNLQIHWLEPNEPR